MSIVPVAVRRVFQLVTVPETYSAGWLRMQLSYISRAIWQPTSREVLSATTVQGSDNCLFVDCTAGAISVTFPAAIQMQFARVTVKKVDATANAITLVGTIDGTVNPQILTPEVSLTIQSDGASWHII